MDAAERQSLPPRQVPRRCFPGLPGAMVASAAYGLLVTGALVAIVVAALPLDAGRLLSDRQFWHALRLSLITATISTALAMAIAVPCGRALGGNDFRGRSLMALWFELPLLLSPAVLGFGLLALCLTPPGRALEESLRSLTGGVFGDSLRIAYDVPAIVLAQFLVTAAIAVSCQRAAPAPAGGNSDAGSPHCPGTSVLLTALVTWARAIGEFGPVLIAADAIALKTEVLPTGVYVELKSGRLQSAAGAALVLVVLALIALGLVRMLGGRPSFQVQRTR